MRTIRWGIIGTGTISTKFATALINMEGTELAAVASRDITRARDFAGRFSIGKAYGSYMELAADPGIDVIYIGTPHTEHKANAALCISNGKAVLCEKPFTLNQKDTEYLIGLAKEHNVFLMEAMWTKFHPATKAVKRWIKEKAIGEVRYMRASFGFYSEFNPRHRLFNPELAGGALLDVGIYPISYVIYLMDGLPDQVSGSAYLGRSGVDEVNAVTMRYKQGVIADLSSAISADTGDEALIIGDKGKIVVPHYWMGNQALRYDAQGKLTEEFHHSFITNGYEYEAEEVNRCLREGRTESDIIPLSDTLGVMTVMDGLRKEWGLSYPQERV